MSLLLLGVSPPTDIERRVRELQRELHARLSLPEAMAVPVAVPIALRAEAQTGGAPAAPEGRLESGRLVTGPFARASHWLLWSLQPAPSLIQLAQAWGGPFGGPRPPCEAGSRLPLAAGFPLGFSLSPSVLERALTQLGTEPPRTFQPLALELYRLRPLAEGKEEVAAWDWARVLGRGLFWEEIARKPLRRPS
ncbi:MAG: hypothetical protein JW820_12890 [Spirochaetales bacterium]|nr:hypothetical protein [Spirochaetales bacterium]